MNHTALSLISGAGLLNAAGQLLLKLGTQRTGVIRLARPWRVGELGRKLGTAPGILVGLVCYGASTLLWIPVLSRVDVMVAYPMVSFGYAVGALVAWRYMGEAMTLYRFMGIAVIMAGVFILSRS
jgi:multidrug transporter EmrE-like cation transporter